MQVWHINCQSINCFTWDAAAMEHGQCSTDIHRNNALGVTNSSWVLVSTAAGCWCPQQLGADVHSSWVLVL